MEDNMKKTYKKPSIFSEDLRLCFVTKGCNVDEAWLAENYNSDEIGENFTMGRVFFPQWPGNNPCQYTPQDYNKEFGGNIEVCYLNPDDNHVLLNS